MPRCHPISLGCPKNRVDTERLLGSPGLDITLTDTPDEADFVFINTCGFIRPAVEESLRTIAETVSAIEGPDRPLLVVGGCLVGRYPDGELAEGFPEVDLWLDNRELDRWPALLAAALALPEQTGARGRLLSTGPSYAWLKVGDGCRHACSFCTIPRIRGPYHSYPQRFLVDEARALLDRGVRELILVAQDLTAWGRDLDGKLDLRNLLDELLPLKGLDRLRLMYLYPSGLNRELLSYLREAGPPFVPYFDVPLQHAHPDVLGRMGRPFARNPMEAVERIRAVFPDAALRTSLIVGFPGETEQQFAVLHDFVRQVRFTQLGVFTYEAEEGTPAAEMPGQIDPAVKSDRWSAIMRTQAEISREHLEPYLGRRIEVLVDQAHAEWPGLHIGRAWFQAPEFDGHVYVSGPGVAPGALVEAEIVEVSDYDLTALA